MKSNKTISLSNEAFKRAKKIENFSGWVEDRIMSAGDEERLQMRLEAFKRAQVSWIENIHAEGYDCRSITGRRCDQCDRYWSSQKG
jgi:hypothetical protein